MRLRPLEDLPRLGAACAAAALGSAPRAIESYSGARRCCSVDDAAASAPPATIAIGGGAATATSAYAVTLAALTARNSPFASRTSDCRGLVNTSGTSFSYARVRSRRVFQPSALVLAAEIEP